MSYLFSSHRFHKIVNYFIFELLKNKIWASFQRIRELFIQKIVNKLSKIWVWDPGSSKNQSRNPDQGSKRHRIRIRNTALQYSLWLVASQEREGRWFHSCAYCKRTSTLNTEQYTRSCLSHLKLYIGHLRKEPKTALKFKTRAFI